MKLTWQSVDLVLRETFVSHKGVKPRVLAQFRVMLHWHGHTGQGWALPAPDYGTDNAGIEAALDRCRPLLDGRAPSELEWLSPMLETACAGQMSALAALDMAMHDLLGHAAGMPVRDLLGCRAETMPDTFASIGMMSPEAAREKAIALRGWSRLKLKMGAQPDVERVRAVREVFDGLLGVDGNGAWACDAAPGILRSLADAGVDLVEQPIAPGQLDALRRISADSPVPVVADEDCFGPESVLRLRGCVHGVNIKLLKCGGLRPALKAIWIAQASGMRVMLGCKIESTIGITAMAQLGGLADWVDLDGHLTLDNDPCIGLQVDHGRLRLPEGPGFGLLPAAKPVPSHA